MDNLKLPQLSEQLITKRLVLRRLVLTDYDKIRPMLQDETVMARTGFLSALSKERIRELLQEWSQKEGVWGAFERNTDSFVGWIMLRHTRFSDREIGFMLPVEQWGKGFATEMAQALICFARDTSKLRRIVATTQAENKSSIRILEKLGMRCFDSEDGSSSLKFYELLLMENEDE